MTCRQEGCCIHRCIPIRDAYSRSFGHFPFSNFGTIMLVRLDARSFKWLCSLSKCFIVLFLHSSSIKVMSRYVCRVKLDTYQRAQAIILSAWDWNRRIMLMFDLHSSIQNVHMGLTTTLYKTIPFSSDKDDLLPNSQYIHTFLFWDQFSSFS